MRTLNTSLLALAAALAAVAVPTASYADLSYNVGAVSEYRYRGIAQTKREPALQGGVDFSAGGLYLGAWASTIKWIKDAGKATGVDTGSSNVELDLYGGYKGELSKGLSYDVGGLYYAYPSNKYGDIPGASSANTFEVYGALTYGVFTAKYSHALTNLFGTGGSDGAPNSKGSGYLDLSATFDLGSGFTFTPHFGRQEVHHYAAASYNDYSLTFGKDFGNGFSASAGLVVTSADKDIFVTAGGKYTGSTVLVVGGKYSF